MKIKKKLKYVLFITSFVTAGLGIYHDNHHLVLLSAILMIGAVTIDAL